MAKKDSNMDLEKKIELKRIDYNRMTSDRTVYSSTLLSVMAIIIALSAFLKLDSMISVILFWIAFIAYSVAIHEKYVKLDKIEKELKELIMKR